LETKLAGIIEYGYGRFRATVLIRSHTSVFYTYPHIRLKIQLTHRNMTTKDKTN